MLLHFRFPLYGSGRYSDQAAAACWMAYIYLSKRTGAAFLGGSGLALAMVVGALIVLPAGVIQAEGALAEPDLLGSALVVALASCNRWAPKAPSFVATLTTHG